jgi:hypothetical protein
VLLKYQLRWRNDSAQFSAAFRPLYSGAGPFVLEGFNIEGGRGVGYDVSLLTFFRRPLMPSETDGL